MEVYSHRGKPFITHVREIVEIGSELIDLLGPKDENLKNNFKQLLKFLAFFHDLGKLTGENQKAINEGKERLPHQHSLHSIIFKIFCKNEKFGKLLNEIEKEIVYFIARYHHSLFPNFLERDEKICKELDTPYFKSQIIEILSCMKESNEFSKTFREFFNLELSEIIESLNLKDSQTLDKLLDEIKKEEEEKRYQILGLEKGIREHYHALGIERSELVNVYFYIDTLFLSSIFFLSDILSATGEEEIFREEVKKKILDEKVYSELEKKFDEYMNKISSQEYSKLEINQIRKECYNEFVNIYSKEDKRIIKISLPTGIGKTYIGMKIALTYAKKNGMPIVYALPFISIIEQNEERFKEILGENNVEKYHHLAFLETIENENETSKEILNFKLSPVFITTFVQVFDSFFPKSKEDILKFPFIINSTIILDEIQCFDPKFYEIFENLIEALQTRFNLSLIIMSATLPPIFRDIENPSEKEEKYYEYFNRYKIKFLEEIEFNNYKKHLLESVKSSNKKRIGIICNRVREAQEIFKYLKDGLNCHEEKKDQNYIIAELEEYKKKVLSKIPEVDSLKEEINNFFDGILQTIKDVKVLACENENYLLLYLAANIINATKLERIKFLLNLAKEKVKVEKKMIIVTTQVIEAGVDFDFEIIYRDFAPLESLVQSAGRVNRNYKRKEPEIVEVRKVYFLESSEKKYSYKKVYPDYLIEKTALLIEHFLNNRSLKEIEEREIFQMSKKYLSYFEYMKEKLDIGDLKFEEIRKGFQLIEEKPYSLDLVLDVSDGKNDEGVFEKYQRLKEVLKGLEKKDRFIIYRKIFPLLEFLQAKMSLDKKGVSYIAEKLEEGKIKLEIKNLEMPHFLEGLQSIKRLFIKEKNLYDNLCGFRISNGFNEIYVI